MKNIILDTDAYKLTHHLQYPGKIKKLYSYGESRNGSRYETVSFFGLQSIIKDNFLEKITDEMIEEANELSYLTFGTYDYFNEEVWKKVQKLGYLPIRIKSVPEGSEVEVSNVLFTLESTEEWFASSLNTLETLLMHVWYPVTISTNSLYIKKDLEPLVKKTGSLENLELMVHDFGLRGATGLEAGKRGGSAHLVHFRSSDNMPATKEISDNYGFKGRALSIWATEHSVSTVYGPGNGEINYMKSQLDNSPINLPFAVVIDSYDPINFIKNVVGNKEVVDKIKNREGRVVFRPDSGKPEEIVLSILNELEKIFGSSLNEKNYKILNNNVGVIQGDGMNKQTIKSLFEKIISEGWSTDNLVVGSGGGLLQEGFTRDTQRFAIKASYYIDEDGQKIDIFKDPKFDSSKRSKQGELKLIKENGKFKTVSKDQPGEDKLRVVLENGNFFPENFEKIVLRTNQN